MDLRKVPLLSLLALALCAQAGLALDTGRHGHTSTLLPDGNILFLGGTIGAANVGTATGEIYFTSAAAFGASLPIASGVGGPVAKSSHTATLMGDGRLLVAGGFVNGTPTAASYVYSPLTAAWAGPFNLGTARGGHTATLINKGTNSGKVLICGGQTAGATSITSTCEIYTPSTDLFAPVQSMSSERLGHTASAIAGGRVFVSGGRRWDAGNSTFTYLSTNEIYDPENDQWQAVTALTTGRADHSAVVLNNGTILISGGYNGTNKLDSPEEGWYKTLEGSQANHNPGNKGYLDSAEIFDSYGGRVPVNGTDHSVMPYRNSKHAAALTGDGEQHLYGGYGNIPPTYFQPEIDLEDGSVLNLVKTNITSATVNDATSVLRFLLETELVRPIDGRFVDADIFLSRPSNRYDTSITVDNASIYIDHSTVPVDGSPVGAISTGLEPGEFQDMLRMDQAYGTKGPTGRVVFAPQDAVSEGAIAAAGTSFSFSSPLAPETQPTQLTAGSQLVTPLVFNVPAAYAGGVISGSATITAGVVMDSLGFWNINLTSGSAQFTSDPVYIDPISGQGVASCPSVTFAPLVGTILNSTVTALNSPINGTGDEVSSLAMRVRYTSTRINVAGLPYSVDISTFMVREMIFADDVIYSPADASWDFGPVYRPVFNHTALVTPAADVFLSGGRDCESAPIPDCRRAVKTFTATQAGGAYILYRGEDWPTSGNLKHKRSFHSSTLLPDGRILTCGGSDGTATLDSCELYSPESRTWEEAGVMTTPRSKHTATLLPNGRVLATGGSVSASTHTTALAEIYYPETDRWVSVNSMAYSRANHTAVLMPDGNVLVAAGNTVNGYSTRSELFITTGAVWQTVGDLGTGRAQHTATLLKNGNVMVTGGINGTGPLRSIEIYDPAARTWANPGWNMQVARYSHTANLLLDGRVMVTGGSDGTGPLDQAEILIGSSWENTADPAGPIFGNNMLLRRANHRSTLLPNGKLLLTGGEQPGEAHSGAEGYDVDFSTFQSQGKTSRRSNHTAVLLKNNRVLVIGGWDGSQHLDSVADIYFSYEPDSDGFESAVSRNPVVSTATSMLAQGDSLTLRSSDGNLHGASEASGGGSGSMNSSFHNPRIYLQQMDSPSGFLIDATTRLYSLYGGPNTNWEKTISSITIVTPTNAWELPYGWYKARVAANGQFSEGVAVQVSNPRPTGAPGIPTGSVLGTSSITWTWTSGTVSAADGYMIYSSSDGVFISTAAFGATAAFTQTGLQPNTPISIMVGAYNLGGGGPLTPSGTYYTLAAVPASLRVASANFTTADLSWSASNNSPVTPFELSISPDSDFANPLLISTPIPFSSDYTETEARVTSLSANRMYYFRLRARNGAGIATAFSPSVSTITVGSVNNFTGTAISTYAINWAWSSSTGADYYEFYDFDDEENPVYIGSTTATDFTQSGLLPDRPYTLAARAMKLNPGFGAISGPFCAEETVYTLAAAPSAHPSDPFIDVTTGSFVMNWVGNGNPSWTPYQVSIATTSDFLGSNSTFSVTGETVSFNGLSPNVRYYARIAAVNGDNALSAYVTLGPKYTLARPPTGVAPSAISMSGVTISWDTNDNSEDTAYELRGTTSSFSNTYTTYVPFSRLYTDDTYTLTGLLTSTTYYFDVTARNGEGLLSARVQSVPPVFTVPGPTGSPSGSIGGVAAAGEDTVISGTLPNMRQVSLSIPAGAFASQTSIAISSSITSACGGYTVCGRTMEVAIFSENGAQPQVPVTLELAYECTIPDTSNLVLARYNPVSGQCLPLETKINPGTRKVTATLNHFSVFQLMVRTASASLNDVLIYPNPFKTNRGNGFVTMVNMPASAKVRIYTLSGTKVWEGTAGTTGILIWRGVNKAGQQVASGVYMVVVDSSAGKKTFKVAVER